jgi:hypothetical protein
VASRAGVSITDAAGFGLSGGEEARNRLRLSGQEEASRSQCRNGSQGGLRLVIV